MRKNGANKIHFKKLGSNDGFKKKLHDVRNTKIKFKKRNESTTEFE